MFATDQEMKSRTQRLLAKEPLRLTHSGRLEPMKGSQDLIAIARELRDSGIAFTIAIFGTGSLLPVIRGQIEKFKLQNQKRINRIVDFETELVPFVRAHGDIYLCCHRQSDPS